MTGAEKVAFSQERVTMRRHRPIKTKPTTHRWDGLNEASTHG